MYICGLLMHAKKYRPSILTGAMLDAFLEKGWFRMGQSVFTTHYIRFHQSFYPVVWLRYYLRSGIGEIAGAKLKKMARRFSVDFAPWRLTGEQEELFGLYRSHSGLHMSPSLHEILLDQQSGNIFDTWQVTLRDGDRLAGLGIIDLGARSAAGISNIYHPDFRKYSPGKLLMMLKIRYCVQQGYHWFYPGYAVPGYRRFDYKIEVVPSFTEYFHAPHQTWLPYEPQAGLPNYLRSVELKLGALLLKLRSAGFPCRMVYYPAFDLTLSDEFLPAVLNQPVFLLLRYEEETGFCTLALYAPEKEGFAIINCHPLYRNGWVFEGSSLICYDVLEMVEGTDAIFSEDEILITMGA